MNDQVTQMFQQPGGMDAFRTAQQIAGMLKSQRTQERTQPVISTLTNLGNQYKAAQTDEQRQGYNRQASQVRGNYLAGGGSPTELPSHLWGADTAQGYQTTEGYQAPITGYEGLGRTNTMALVRQARLDAMERRLQESGLTGIDPWTGKETADQAYRMMSLQNRLSGGGGSSKSGTGQDDEWKAQIDYHGQNVDAYLMKGDINGAVKYLNSQYGRGLITSDQYNILIGDVSAAENEAQGQAAAQPQYRTGGATGLIERLAHKLYGPSIYGN